MSWTTFVVIGLLAWAGTLGFFLALLRTGSGRHMDVDTERWWKELSAERSRIKDELSRLAKERESRGFSNGGEHETNETKAEAE